MSKQSDKRRTPAKSLAAAEPKDASSEAIRALAAPGDWLSQALEHHDQIRSAFAFASAAAPGGARLAAFKGLAVLLNGHSIAEEIVLYPALAQLRPARAAETAYAEQTEAKVRMAQLELTDPASAEWLPKLEEIRGAVLEHMAEEEGEWFPMLKRSDASQSKLSARYQEEFCRYTRTGHIATNATWDGPPRNPDEQQLRSARVRV